MTKDTQLNKWPHGQIYCKHAKCFNHLYYVNTRFIHSFDTLIPLSNSQTSGLQFISFSRIDSLIEFRILTEIPDDRALNLAEFQARYLCDTANTVKAQICTTLRYARACYLVKHDNTITITSDRSFCPSPYSTGTQYHTVISDCEIDSQTWDTL